MSPYKSIPDPFPGKGPIPKNDPSFYERVEHFTKVQTLLRAGESVSLVGERKAGKTSFLNYLLTHLPSDEFIPVFIDAQVLAPQTDKIFLGELASYAADTITQKINLNKPIKTETLTAPPDEVYRVFRSDLERLQNKLPLDTNGQKYRLIWLIDEIDILKNYENSEFFPFLRALAQSNPYFRMVVAGYDVLYTLSTNSPSSPFFNAFQHIPLESLNPVVAQRLIDDALKKMGATIEPDLYESILQWTGQKPFFLKWSLSKIAEVLNQRQIDYHINTDIWLATKILFLSESNLRSHFDYIWKHTTASQQKILSLIAPQVGPYYHPTILDNLREEELIEGDQQSLHLSDDLTRLEQLGCLYVQTGRYTFTSGCLQDWIKQNKPLD